ncbi:Major facilitator superfamily associated domain [Trinorchestia longiramus]|nr:Major facilitator superfamily associated domain [Trinorchestia longiramus]
MKIDKETLLIKLHYFMFSAGMAPIMPFIFVIGMQLGISVTVMGALDSLILIFSTIMKPLISMVADAIPKSRRPLLIVMVFISCITLGLWAVTPSFKDAPRFTAWIADDASNETFWNFDSNSNSYSENVTQEFYHAQLNRDFSQTCSNKYSYEHANNSDKASLPWPELQVILALNNSCELQSGRDCNYSEKDSLLQLKLLNSSLPFGYAAYSITAPDKARVLCADIASPASIECAAGKWNKSHCGGSVFQSKAFWYFVVIMVVREIAYSTTNSFTDAITVDTVGIDGSYGGQRLWKIVGRMLLSPISSAIVDWYSGDAETKDYTPAYVLASIFAAFDVIVCYFLKVPELKRSESIWKESKLLLSKYQFLMFLFFTLMSGMLNATPMMYLFVLQEELATGTPAMKHLKLMQGLTIFVRCFSQIPCSLYADQLVRRFGASKIQTAVFGLHALRLSLLSAVAKWGSVWGTLVVEVLDGPVYGLGYPLVVLYARQFTPPGLTNTVQSLANNAYDILCFALSSAIVAQMFDKFGGINTFMIWAVVGVVGGVLHALFDHFTQPLDHDGPAASGMDQHVECEEGVQKERQG